MKKSFLGSKALRLLVVSIIVAGAIVVIESRSLFQPSPARLDAKANDVPLGVEPGKKLPDFTLKTLDGKRVSLNDFRGKPVFVNFWATWCSNCRDEMVDFQKLQDEFGDKIVILAINRGESIEKQERFIDMGLREKITVTYFMLVDPEDRMAEEFFVRPMPTTFVVDGKGIIVKVKVGQMLLPEMRELARIALGEQK